MGTARERGDLHSVYRPRFVVCALVQRALNRQCHCVIHMRYLEREHEHALPSPPDEVLQFLVILKPLRIDDPAIVC
eukprot:COSAG05_NODE_331_length_11273_cov_3.896635_13_plen_76_part_00